MKRLITINSYRGQRILLALPCRGQRTRTNASTVKRQLGKLRSRLKPRLGLNSACPLL
jgi:ribosomal protein S13